VAKPFAQGFSVEFHGKTLNQDELEEYFPRVIQCEKQSFFRAVMVGSFHLENIHHSLCLAWPRYGQPITANDWHVFFDVECPDFTLNIEFVTYVKDWDWELSRKHTTVIVLFQFFLLEIYFCFLIIYSHLWQIYFCGL